MTSDVSAALTGFRTVDSAMGRMGRTMTTVGSTLSRSVTLPVVAAGAASVKMALDYEQAFTKIAAISNTSAKEVARWKEEVKGLAVATGRDPRQLADALFFLASAGLKSGQVMDTLKATAKASAVGLGEMTDIAKLTANVLNAYAKSGITASRATDILVAAVKAGTAEPEEFAGAIGRILPIASKAQVGFDQVAASLAALSNIGLDVNEGVTAMRGVLQSLIAPTNMARDAMKDIGLSAQDLLDAFQQDGILGAFQLLDDRVSANSKTQAEWFGLMRQIIPNIRALTGEFALTGENAKQVGKIFDQVTNDTTALADAFEKTQKDPAFQLQQQLAKLKVAAIDVGGTLIPVAKDIVEVIGDLAEGFSKLSPATRESIVKWSLLAAALGPVLVALGGIVRLAGGFIGAAKKIATGLGMISAAQTGGALATAGAGAAATGGLSKITPFGQALPPAAAAGGGAAAGAAAKMALPHVLKLTGAIAGLSYALGTVPTAPTKAIPELFSRALSAVESFNLSMDDHNRILDQVEQNYGTVTNGAQRLAIMALQLGGTVKAGAFAFLDSADAAGAFVRSIHGATDITQQQRNAIATATNAIYEMGGSLRKTEQSMISNLLASGDFTGALGILNTALSRGQRVLEGAVGSHRKGTQAAEVHSQKIRGLAGAYEELPSGTVGPKIQTSGADKALSTVQALAAWIQRLDGMTATTFINQRVSSGKMHGGGLVLGRFHGGGGVGGAGDVPILAQAGEFVWARDAVRNVGGPAALGRVHNYFKRMHSGGPVGHQHGGGGGAGLGSLIAAAGQLAQQLQRMAKDAERRSQVEQELDRILTRIGGRFEKSLSGFSATFDELQTKIDDLASTIADFQEGVKSGITGFASLSNLLGTPTGPNPGATLMAYLQGQLGTSQQFSSIVQELQAAGLDPGLLQQLATAGPEMLTILQAIQQAGVGNVNQVWGQITALAQSTAEALSGPLFGKQVDDLNKALGILEKDFRQLSKTFQELPKQVKRDFADQVSELGRGLGELARILKHIPGMQHGGTMAHPGGLAMVGEAGPELVRLPGGAQVIPAGQGAGMPAASLEGVAIEGTLDVETGRLVGKIVRAFPRMHEDHHFRARQKKSTL